MTRALFGQENGGLDGPLGKKPPGRGFVGQLDPLIRTGQDDSVIPKNATAPEGVHTYLVFGTDAGVTFSAVLDRRSRIELATLGRGFSQGQGVL